MGFDLCRVFGYFLLGGAFMSLFLSLYCFCYMSSFYVDWELINYLVCEVSMTLIFDWMSMGFLSFVLFISGNVMLYSVDYMEGDEGKAQFCLVVLMFVFSMVLLIVSPNLISLLLGWDGLGLVSYCLVIYYQNYRSYNAGMITVLSNWIGDVALLLAISLMVDFGEWGYDLYSDMGGDEAVFFLCMLAAMTSSAQIPFSVWLPAAMAAPTPVSSLVHSSTLVTAGVYLMVRFNSCMTSSAAWLLMGVSCATMFMAGLGANYEYDLSKIIALSTLSQLGLMMLALSLGMVELAFFHLLTHAIFSALLFLCAWVIIHTSSDWQDIRRMGGLVGSLPYVSSCMMVANLALCGFPFMASVYSKDMVLEWMLMGGANFFVVGVMIFSIGLTACYSFRLGRFVMSSEAGGPPASALMDGGTNMYWPIGVLSFLGCIIGGCFMWILLPWEECVCLPVALKLSGVLFMAGGFWAGSLVFWASKEGGGQLVEFVGDMWFLPGLSGQYVSLGLMSGAESYGRLGDFGWGESVGGQGVKVVLGGG